jgi:hypothetical protein
MKKKKIRALEIKPMDHPSVCYIEPTIKAFKKAVGADLIEYGDIEAKMIAYRVYAVFNKDRFLTSLEPNRQIGDDIIVGTMFIVAVDENRLPISLTDEQIDIYSSMFYGIEIFDDIDVVEANINTMISKLIQYDVL